MKQCSTCNEIKDLLEFSKNKKSKDGFQHKCKKCHKEYRKENEDRIAAQKALWYKENREEILADRVTYYIENWDAVNARNVSYYKEHKEEIAAYKAEWYEEHKEEIAADRIIYWPIYRKQNEEKIRIKNSTYKKENPEIGAAQSAKRRATKRKATPKWLKEEQDIEIKAFYVEAAKKTKETGIPHEVDHIVPLQGKNVSGLHVPWNLQVLPEDMNRIKHNRFDSISHDTLYLPLLIKEFSQNRYIQDESVA